MKMLSAATFGSLLERGDVLVKDGDAYRPLAANDAHRRMYVRLSDGTHVMLAFTGGGTDGPGAAPQRVRIDIGGSVADAVRDANVAAAPYTSVVGSCLKAYVLFLVGVAVVGMAAVALFGDYGQPGLLARYPFQSAVIAAIVIWIVIARRRRRR
ncbi:MAG: hypothetical protein ABFE08_16235 [Armatimonadia bacterium]